MVLLSLYLSIPVNGYSVFKMYLDEGHEVIINDEVIDTCGDLDDGSEAKADKYKDIVSKVLGNKQMV